MFPAPQCYIFRIFFLVVILLHIQAEANWNPSRKNQATVFFSASSANRNCQKKTDLWIINLLLSTNFAPQMSVLPVYTEKRNTTAFLHSPKPKAIIGNLSQACSERSERVCRENTRTPETFWKRRGETVWSSVHIVVCFKGLRGPHTFLSQDGRMCASNGSCLTNVCVAFLSDFKRDLCIKTSGLSMYSSEATWIYRDIYLPCVNVCLHRCDGKCICHRPQRNRKQREWCQFYDLTWCQFNINLQWSVNFTKTPSYFTAKSKE